MTRLPGFLRLSLLLMLVFSLAGCKTIGGWFGDKEEPTETLPVEHLELGLWLEADRMGEAKWYAIQTYSGHENKVQRLIQRRIDEETGEPEDKQIQEVLVPTQEAGTWSLMNPVTFFAMARPQ